MTKNEYLTLLMNELEKNNVPDAADIVSEYEQHFAFKLADGFSEEEISAKLGDPIALASQFDSKTNVEQSHGRKAVTLFGLVFADLFTGMFFALLCAWEVVMAAFSLASAVTAVCLFGHFNIYSLIPPMPYWCGAVFGLSLLALSVLTAIGCVFFAAFIRQLMSSYARFHHNSLAAASGSPVLPSVSIRPQFPAKVSRKIRTVALISLAIFAACFVLAMIVSMISSGALGFWHAWGWFGYPGLK